MAGDGSTAHLDGLRATLEEDDDRLRLVLSFVLYGRVIDRMCTASTRVTVEDRARMSRQLVVAQAMASYFSYGGTTDELQACLHDFAAFDHFPEIGLPHVFTRVDATRTHVFRDDDAREFLVVTEDVGADRMTADQVRTAIVEPPQHEYRPGDSEDWSFVDEIPEGTDDEDGLDDGGPEGLQSLPPPDGG